MKVDRFEVGPAWCLITLQLVAECPHCAKLRKIRSRGLPMKVTGVDRETGTVTFSSATLSDAERK